MSRIAPLALVAFAVLMAVYGAFGVVGVTRSQFASTLVPLESPHRMDLAQAPHGALTEQMLKDADEDAAVDLYGNEVTPAVATYTYDDLGTLYEVHSPQTEVPRLGSPKS